jgi:catechol 1,2-dioxygenase
MSTNNTNKPLEPEDTLNGAGRYDPNFTNHVISSMGPNTDARLRKVMTSLIRHVHDFAREVDLTVDEWMAGVDMINRAGQMSTDRRNEGQLLCDVIGLESLVDEITFKAAADTKDALKVPSWVHFSDMMLLCERWEIVSLSTHQRMQRSHTCTV